MEWSRVHLLAHNREAGEENWQERGAVSGSYGKNFKNKLLA